jgi:hypothetical protein
MVVHADASSALPDIGYILILFWTVSSGLLFKRKIPLLLFTRKDVLGWWLVDASSEAGVLDEHTQLSQLSGVAIPARQAT